MSGQLRLFVESTVSTPSVGFNDSLTHAGFTIGSSEVEITGVREDGGKEPVMAAGEWAF